MSPPAQLHFDVETLDTIQTAKILSIGAVFEDDSFYVEIDHSLYPPEASFTVSKSTEEWWAARGGFQPTQDRLFSPYEATTKFHVWIRQQTENIKDWEVWANSPSFDCQIMRYHFAVFKLACPWPFWAERDVRTAYSIAKTLNLGVKKPVNPHNALQDASNQRVLVEHVHQKLVSHVDASRKAQYSNYKLDI